MGCDVQGILGSTPWNALVFLTLYMQLLGMTDTAAAALMALFLGGTALGGLLGGFVGDLAAKRYPSHGRILVCQFSVVSGVPLSLLLLKVACFCFPCCPSRSCCSRWHPVALRAVSPFRIA